MAVRDSTVLHTRCVYVTNSDVAASATFGTKYCNEYGIPSANRLSLALGTAANKRDFVSEADLYSNVLTPIYNAVVAVNATCIIVGAGCPAAIELWTWNNTGPDYGSDAGGAFDFVHLCGAIKYIVGSIAHCPRVISDGSGGYKLVRKANNMSWMSGFAEVFASQQSLGAGAANFGSVLESYANSNYADAVASDPGNDHNGYNIWTRYKSSYTPSLFSGYNFLPCGWAGYWSFEETTHPASLATDSVAILNRAIASEGIRSSLTSRKILCGLGNYSGTRSELAQAARWSTVAKRFIDLGFAVEYFYSDTSDVAGDYLVPWAGAKSGWSPTTLDDGSASGSVSYAMAFGPAFANGAEAGGSGPVWHGSSDNIRTTANGLMVGGKSSNGRWVKANQLQGGHSGFAMQNEVGGQHAGNANCLAILCDAMMAVIDGYTLIEAGFIGWRGSFYPVGDPLCRPFKV